MKRLLFLGAASLFLFSCGGDHTQPPAEETSTGNTTTPGTKDGKTLFMDNCSQCHRVERAMTGPALAGVLSRWNNDTTKLVRFIRNSQQVIKEGDAYAGKLYQEWNETQMPANTHLSEAEVRNIIGYLAEGHD